MGKGPNPAHRFAIRCLKNLKNQSCHIEKVVKRQTTQEILNNRLRIKASMRIVKTRLRNRMEDDFLVNYFIVYIEKEIAERFIIDMIMDDFYSIKERRAQLK
jgi:hypothetical protein